MDNMKTQASTSEWVSGCKLFPLIFWGTAFFFLFKKVKVHRIDIVMLHMMRVCTYGPVPQLCHYWRHMLVDPFCALDNEI